MIAFHLKFVDTNSISELEKLLIELSNIIGVESAKEAYLKYWDEAKNLPISSYNYVVNKMETHIYKSLRGED